MANSIVRKPSTETPTERPSKHNHEGQCDAILKNMDTINRLDSENTADAGLLTGLLSLKFLSDEVVAFLKSYGPIGKHSTPVASEAELVEQVRFIMRKGKPKAKSGVTWAVSNLYENLKGQRERKRK